MKIRTLPGKTRILLLFTLLGAAIASVQSVDAATITVMNTNDSGSGSLRQAIAGAASGDTINFSLPANSTITLTSGELLIAKNLTISGPGANTLAVSGNNASRVFNIGSGEIVTISSLTVANGSAPKGGGILNDHGTLTVSNCAVSGNSGNSVFDGGPGGGIYNDHAILTVNNSTISGNSAIGGDGGGGIYNDHAILTVNNSTISGNSSGRAHGGGIVNDAITINRGSATLVVNNSTISGNSGFGQEIYNSSGTVELTDTILNTGTILNTEPDENIENDGGTVTSHGYNLSSDAGVTNFNGGTGSLTATGDQTNTDPKLGPLAYYGGPTPTHILKTGSPAIDAGDPNFTPPPNYDQRGVSFARVVNSRIDIGAFERQASDIDPTLVVTKTADTNDGTCDSDCSLREAITAANTSAPDDVIYFAVTGTITLNSLGTLPALNSNMKILGPGANALAVQRDPAAANFRIFTVNSGKTDTISGLTIRNGADNFGGGGIYNDHAILTVTNSTISGNSGDSVGGGIYSDANGGSATLTVTNSTISGNSAGGIGGGIISDAGNSGSATLTITNSTISGNSAGGSSAGFGGGIFNDGRLSISATLTVTNSTLSGNSGTFGGGIFNTVGATLEIGGTILKNTGTTGANIFNEGTFTSHGYNLSSDGTGPNNGTTDQTNTDPMLGPLADNGGPTQTHALLPGSPAIDKGKNVDSLPTDQRGPGFARTFDNPSIANATGGDGTDIGAFEVQNTPPTITGSTISRQKGAASSNSQVATVSDAETPAGDLVVTLVSEPTGITVTNIVNTNGTVTADVAADCDATVGANTVVLEVSDGQATATANVTVNVTANSTPPVITLKPATILQPDVNHKYHTFTITNMVQSATDDCDGNVISSVVIEKATSDEPDGGDSTLNDIVIASGCKSVQLRAERDGTKDGRVYLVTLRVSDTSGNVTHAVYKISVPVGKKPAVNSGVAYTVNSNCPP